VNPLNVAVVGGGPAGLRAAEVAAMGGARVSVYDAKPSVGRKFLVAGKGGMNITHDEELAAFVQRYRQTGDPIGAPSVETICRWTSLLKDFDPAALRSWAAGLGVETFTATTGRVYPREMKSAPLLRRWVARLRSLGVVFHTRHQWTGLNGTAPLQLAFRTERGTQTLCGRGVKIMLVLINERA
jgi:predicted flavoprotein YhiN